MTFWYLFIPRGYFFPSSPDYIRTPPSRLPSPRSALNQKGGGYFFLLVFNRNFYKPSILLVHRTVARTGTQDRDGRNLDGCSVVYLRRSKGRIQVTQATTTRNAGVAQEEIGDTITAVITILDHNIIINYYSKKIYIIL